jgi:hypothetical protein
MKILFRALPLLLSLLISCNSTPKKQSSDDHFVTSESTGVEAEVQEIIYALCLPTDISQLFDKTGTNFNPELLIPLNTIPGYEDPEQISLAIGALGVDLSYCKIFQQSAPTAEYYEAVEQLSGKLKIPASIFESSSKKLDLYFENQDSLTIIINNIYADVNSHFQKNGHEELASISLFGGWIEAMFIAANIYDNENHLEMGDRILHQKFALNDIISLLSNHQESLRIRGYVLLLNKLKDSYDGVDIMYHKEGFDIDTTQKKLQTTGAELSYDEETLDEICLLVRQIHSEVFN